MANKAFDGVGTRGGRLGVPLSPLGCTSIAQNRSDLVMVPLPKRTIKLKPSRIYNLLWKTCTHDGKGKVRLVEWMGVLLLD